MSLSNGPGLYIVTLKNSVPISVNAHDKRIAHKCIKVTKHNCKFGKAVNLESRRKNYYKTFSDKNVNFIPIASVKSDFLAVVESLVLEKLDSFRMRGLTGRKNEWLEGINFDQVKDIVIETLNETGVGHILLKNK